MKTKIYQIIVALIFSATIMTMQACEKELDLLPNITVQNDSDNPYKIEVDGETIGNVSGKTSRDFQLSPGLRRLKATQISGYLIFPTVKETEFDLRRGDNLKWTVPF